MSTSIFFCCLSVLAVAIVSARYYDHGYGRMPEPEHKTIADIVAEDHRFSTLLLAVKTAGLVETLSGHGPFTVFAPTNDAFDKIPKHELEALLAHPENLKSVLLRHVLDTKILAADIPEGSTHIKTVGGEQIDIINECDEVRIESSQGEAHVIITDILASNGVIHAVDTVF